MLSRLLVIFLGIPFVFFCLWLGDLSRFLLFFSVSCRGQYEIFSLFPSPAIPKHPILEYVLGGGILYAAIEYGEHGILLAVAVSVLILASAVVLRGLIGDGFKRFSLGIVSLFYLPFCLAFFFLLGKRNGFVELFAVLTSIWVLDIGAYVFGWTLRGPWLSPRISPNKTISGAVGGALSCMAAIWALNQAGCFQIPFPRLAGFGITVSVLGQIGDLFESVLKREAGVKDTAKFLGDHGGMLDRLDSILFLGPVSYYFLVM
jgi:phosphatidate cytidylyltransferase